MQNQDTQPIPPQNTESPTNSTGPGCLAWGLLGVAAAAFSILVVFVAGLLGYLNGQSAVSGFAVSTQQAFIEEQLTTWIPRDIADGNVVLLGARIDGLASLTPAPPQVSALIATGTQFAIEQQPTATPTASPTPPPSPTATATLFDQPTPTPTPPASDNSAVDAPLFDVNALYTEAQGQMDTGDYEQAVLTLDAIIAIDPTFRPDEIEALLFTAWQTQARRLLRAGDSSTLAAGIRAANEASRYGDIDDLSYESYIAGLYLDAQSKEALNPQGAITVYNTIYAQAPNYLDVRAKLYRLYTDLGNASYDAFDFCPAAQQFQAALSIQPGASEIETKLQAAQTSCDGGQPPVDAGTPGTEGTSAPPATATNAPLGQR